jgi:hypothetical protein
MPIVDVREHGGNRRKRLSVLQTGLFLRELGRVTRFFPPVGGGPPPRMAPDCSIIVRKGKRTTRFQLYSRVVLLNERTGKKWQFYCGLLVLEWLYM